MVQCSETKLDYYINANGIKCFFAGVFANKNASTP